MSRRAQFIVGIDADCVAASAVVSRTSLDEEMAGSSPDPVGIGAPAGWPTYVFASTDDGLPYRLDLSAPIPIERDVPAEVLPSRERDESRSSEEASAQAEQHADSAQFLIDQVSSRSADRVGIVVADSLPILTAEAVLRRMRTTRGRIELVPWPVASAWAWIRDYEWAPQDTDSDSKAIVGSVLTIHLSEIGISAVPMHLVWDPISDVRHVTPARDRDCDLLQHESWEPEISPEAAAACVLGLLGSCEHDLAGAVVSGRPFADRWARRFAESLATQADTLKINVLLERHERIGLLAQGAALAAKVVTEKGIPYYETVPPIELYTHQKVWERARKPFSHEYLPFWLNVLDGQEETIDGRHLFPANRPLVHEPDFRELELKSGKIPIRIAFQHRDVREVTAEVPDNIASRQEAVSLRVEYRLGSGRPRVTIHRPRVPDESIEFRWESARHISESRDELTTMDSKGIAREAAERKRLRDEFKARDRGWPQ